MLVQIDAQHDPSRRCQTRVSRRSCHLDFYLGRSTHSSPRRRSFLNRARQVAIKTAMRRVSLEKSLQVENLPCVSLRACRLARQYFLPDLCWDPERTPRARHSSSARHPPLATRELSVSLFLKLSTRLLSYLRTLRPCSAPRLLPHACTKE